MKLHSRKQANSVCISVRRLIIQLQPLFLVAVTLLLWHGAVSLAEAQPATTAPADPLLARGLLLYQANCSSCHGEKGLGDGPAAYLLYPKPRNFSQGVFRLTSSPQGLPSDDDLLRTLRRGMPGSAMPPWGHLPEGDLKALVLAVRSLAVEGKTAQVIQASKSMKREKALQLAHSLLDPRPATPLPARPPDGKIDVNRGKTIYAANCAACHDADGRGRNKRDLTDNSGYPIFARDFTLGVFKGGSSADDIARRLTVGMPGSPMPAAAELSPADLWSLVAYVQSFIKPGAQARVEQSQHTITVKRVKGPITSAIGADAWQNVQPQTLALMPLWWRDERIEVVAVRAIHDGSHIAIQLGWDDPTVDDLPVKPQSFTDGAAIQLARAVDPPSFAMGAQGGVVDLWYWKASRQRDAAATQPALAAAYPNMAKADFGAVHEPVYQTATAVGNLVAQTDHPKSVECLKAQGFGTLTSRGPGAQLADGAATRTSTGWQVVYVHQLGAEEEGGDLVLGPGKTLSIAFAAWDGHAGDRNGQKSVTIWHQLTLEP
jgi:DMSO reductase family type II enzyme heme b subunit